MKVLYIDRTVFNRAKYTLFLDSNCFMIITACCDFPLENTVNKSMKSSGFLLGTNE